MCLLHSNEGGNVNLLMYSTPSRRVGVRWTWKAGWKHTHTHKQKHWVFDMHEYTLRTTVIKKLFWWVFFKSGSLWRANTEEFEALQWSPRSPQWWNPPQTLSIWRVFDGESFSDSLELWEAGGPERRGGCRHSVIELDMDRGCRTRCIHTTFSLVLILIRNPGVSSQETSKTGRPPVIRIPPALTFFSLRKKKSLHVYLY